MSEPYHKIQDIPYGTPNLNWVSSWLAGSAIISLKLVGMLLTL